MPPELAPLTPLAPPELAPLVPPELTPPVPVVPPFVFVPATPPPGVPPPPDWFPGGALSVLPQPIAEKTRLAQAPAATSAVDPPPRVFRALTRLGR